MIIKLSLLLVWILYSLFEGIREAYFWHYKATTKSLVKIELHPLFYMQRIIVFFILLMYIKFVWLPFILYGLSLALIQPFFHNGMYYSLRNKIDNTYPKGWSDQSTTSTAVMTKFLTYRNRIILLVLGLTCLIFSLI